MRWIWIDTFEEFESGRRAVAVKNVTAAEDYLHDYMPGYPILPASLMIEGMAQTAGVLVGEARGFRDNVVLAKIRDANFSDFAIPGDRIRYEATIQSIDDRAAVTQGTVYRNGQPIGTVNLIFSHIGSEDRPAGVPSHNFVFSETMMNLVRGVSHAPSVSTEAAP